MIFRKSVRQFLRTPGKLLLFILLFAVAAFFLCTGAMLWARNRNIVKQYEGTFMTIGTVEQMESSYEVEESYGFENTNTYTSYGDHDHLILDDALNFDGANYIHPAVHRPFYGAWAPEFVLWDHDYAYPFEKPNCFYFVLDFTVTGDFVAGEPVEVVIDHVWTEVDDDAHFTLCPRGLPHAGETWLVHKHYGNVSDKEITLEKGKTYVANVSQWQHNEDFAEQVWELCPEETVLTNQHLPDGTKVEGELSQRIAVQEVTEGFYDTPEGKAWINYGKQIMDIYRTLPVVPTDATELLLPFYRRSLYLIDGEDISTEEYAGGAYVCLIPQRFAERNGLQVGDKLRLPLYFADYGTRSSGSWFPEVGLLGHFYWQGTSRVNTRGELLEVFSDHEYTVKGIYYAPKTSDASMSLGANAVVIPAASVRESDENNIIDYGAMTSENTSFQIPNGSIDAYMALWRQQDLPELTITFYDRGYTQLQRGLENTKRTSTLFLVIGGAMTLALLLFFCDLFITKNKPRTAVERMLGYTKKQCAASLLSGFLLAAVLATVIGCGIGYVAEERLSANSMNKEYYDTRFTIGQTETADTDEISAGDQWVCPAAAGALLLVTFVFAELFMADSLKEEPLLMLGQKNE